MRKVLLLFVVGALLGACSESIFDSKKTKIPGERIPILFLESERKPEVDGASIQLPPPQVNASWPQSGGYPSHAMHHLSIADAPAEVWSSSVGRGDSSDRRLISEPVIAAGRAYVADVSGRVSAYDVENGDRLWRVDLTPEDQEDVPFSGGIAYAYGRLFVSTGFAEAVALDAATGEVIWRRSVFSPMRAAPAVSDGRVFVTTVDSRLFVLDARDGEMLWNHQGFEETAAILGGASPAIADGVVVVPYPSGEIFAMLASNGRIMWSYSLASLRRNDVISSISDIRGNPVIDRDRIFAISHSGRIVAIDSGTGETVWEKEIGGIQTPWVAGKYLYLITSESELICLSREKGEILWILRLPDYGDMAEKENPIVWYGPVLASDRLLVANSNGVVLSVSPYRGTVVSQIKLDDGVITAPVVAQGTIYLLTTDADLVAFR